jgi:hypothetical protein
MMERKLPFTPISKGFFAKKTLFQSKNTFSDAFGKVFSEDGFWENNVFQRGFA